jgi:Ca2+/Na+ antiporter
MAAETETTSWIHPETRRKAVQRAWYRAKAARWDLNIAIFLFGLIAVVCILGFGQVSIWLNAVIAFSGLFTAWLWGRRKAKKVYRQYLEEELTRYPDEWKDYYKILGISPSSDLSATNAAYERLSIIYTEVLSDKTKLIPLYSLMFKEAREAYLVLSDPKTKAEYDRIFWLKYNGESINIEEPAKAEIVGLSSSISREVSDYIRNFAWRLPRPSRMQRRLIMVAVTVLLVIGVSGTSLAFARPDHALAAPFRGTAVTIAQITAGAIDLIEDVRTVAATSERQIISTALQLMRIDKGVKIIAPVTIPTNDMSSFPSPENSLYPDYVDRSYSQFRYTVDEHGIITVHTELASTDQLLAKIKQLIYELE